MNATTGGDETKMALDAANVAAWERFFTKTSSGGTPSSRLIPKGPRRSASSRELGSAFRRTSSKTQSDWDESLKKLRKLVLVEGVPDDEVRTTLKTSLAITELIRNSAGCFTIARHAYSTTGMEALIGCTNIGSRILSISRG